MNQKTWIRRANQVLPAGGFGNFDPGILIREGRGARIWDEDGNEFVDCLISSGPMLLGHGHPEVLEAVQAQLIKGQSFFAGNAKAIELAEAICDAVPCAEQIRFVLSGGEADMYAMRLARAFTGRDKIVKFEGGYHGMSAEAQMSLAPLQVKDYPKPVPDSAGITEAVRKDVLIAPFNNIEITQAVIENHAAEIAGVIVEPMQRIIPPVPGFLNQLKSICDQHGIVLIFDEVVTGFRLAYGGAQEYYGVEPDLCTLGKPIGGGFPLGAVAGKSAIMAHFNKEKVGDEGYLMQVSTLCANPVSASAGLKTLEILRRPGQYDRLFETGKNIMKKMEDELNSAGIEHKIVGEPALFDVVFTKELVTNYRDTLKADKKLTVKFNRALKRKGVFKAPNKFYTSLALTEDDLDQIFCAIEFSAKQLKS